MFKKIHIDSNNIKMYIMHHVPKAFGPPPHNAYMIVEW